MMTDDGVPHDPMSYGRLPRYIVDDEHRQCVGCLNHFHLDDTTADLVRCHDCDEWVCVDCRSSYRHDGLKVGDTICNACLFQRECERQSLTEYDSPQCP